MPTISYDCEITLDQVSKKLKSLIDKLEPFGPKNMVPTFITKNVMDSGNSRSVGADKTHLKLEVTDPHTGTIISGIAFGFGHFEEEIKNGHPFNIAYSIDTNIWKERATIQLMVKDIQFTNMK
jgi:single-stranded-DNA-specific exonuclease